MRQPNAAKIWQIEILLFTTCTDGSMANKQCGEKKSMKQIPTANKYVLYTNGQLYALIPFRDSNSK